MQEDVDRDAKPDRFEPSGWVIALLVAVAILETLGGLSSLPLLFGDPSDIPGPGIGGWTISATIVLHAVFAVAALVFAIRRQIDRAIIALCAVVLTGWLRMLPSFIIHGVDMRGTGMVVAHELFQVILFPVLAVIAIVLALRGTRLPLAAVFACLPTVIGALGVVAFAIGVSIYGF